MVKNVIQWYRNRRENRRHFKKFLDNKAAYDQFLTYLDFRTFLPVVHIVKQNNIHKYREEYGFKVLVETGTYMGDMVQAQLSNFSQIFSVELGVELHRNAVKRFEKYSNVKILQGDSGIVLKDLIKEISEPALFWLDGHYSSGTTAKGDKITPVLEELRTILNSEYIHGILIDDARLFVGEDDYPTIDQVCSFVMELDPDREVIVADDIIRVFKKKKKT